MQEEKKIMIVDDDIDVVIIAQSILEAKGYRVISACCKKDAQHKLIYEQPDLAILDIMMTTMHEGLELAEEMKNNPLSKEIPIIIQTSLDIVPTTKIEAGEMAKAIRKDPLYEKLNLLMVNNYKDGSAILDYRIEGFGENTLRVNGFLRKPIRANALLKMVEIILEKNTSCQGIQQY